MIPWLLGHHSVLVLLIPQWLLLLSHLQSFLLITLKLKCWEWHRVPVLKHLLYLYSLLGDLTQSHSFKYNSYTPKILSPGQSFFRTADIYISSNPTTDIFTWRSNRLLKYNTQNLASNLFPQSVHFLLFRPEILTSLLLTPYPISQEILLALPSNYAQNLTSFLLLLLPPNQSHCNFSCGIQQWCANWSLCFYPCSIILPPSLFSTQRSEWCFWI